MRDFTRMERTGQGGGHSAANRLVKVPLVSEKILRLHSIFSGCEGKPSPQRENKVSPLEEWRRCA